MFNELQNSSWKETQRQATEQTIRIAQLRQRIPPTGTRARTLQLDVPTTNQPTPTRSPALRLLYCSLIHL